MIFTYYDGGGKKEGGSSKRPTEGENMVNSKWKGEKGL